MGDLEQYELNLLRRDQLIGMYHDWYRENERAIWGTRFETLVSWFEYFEECPRCGDIVKATMTSVDKMYYKMSCGHFQPRWDVDNTWDDEIGAWVPN